MIFRKKITDHDHANHITTHEFNKLTSDNFPTNLASKIDIANFVKKSQILMIR